MGKETLLEMIAELCHEHGEAYSNPECQQNWPAQHEQCTDENEQPQ